MDKLSALQTFVRVVEAGSFSAVAKEFGSTQSSVSKSVAALEDNLGVKLLTRTTRSLSLTEQGERYFEEVRRLVGELQAADAALKNGEQQMSGTLRIASAVGYGRRILMPIIDQFIREHPLVNIDLNLNDGFIDIVEQGVDVAIRIGELADSSLLARRVGTSHRALMASTLYLNKIESTIGLPKSPADITQHQCVIYTGLQSHNVWEFTPASGPNVKVRASGNFQSNSSEAIRAATLSGMGLCYSPTWLFQDELDSGEIQILLRDWPMRASPINAVYAQQRKNSAKVKAFIEYLMH